MTNGRHFDAGIAGGGIAGLACALFLARAQWQVAIFDSKQSSLRRVSTLRNYLGFPDGIGGNELLERSLEQVQRFGVRCIDDDVTSVRQTDTGFELQAGGQANTCRWFILASNKRTDLATQLGISLGGFGGRFVSVNPQGETEIPGCYAVGRITGLPSQAQISAGNGAAVAIGLVQKARGGYYVDHDT